MGGSESRWMSCCGNEPHCIGIWQNSRRGPSPKCSLEIEKDWTKCTLLEAVTTTELVVPQHSPLFFVDMSRRKEIGGSAGGACATPQEDTAFERYNNLPKRHKLQRQ
jgi:hypothetical protein